MSIPDSDLPLSSATPSPFQNDIPLAEAYPVGIIVEAEPETESSLNQFETLKRYNILHALAQFIGRPVISLLLLATLSIVTSIVVLELFPVNVERNRLMNVSFCEVDGDEYEFNAKLKLIESSIYANGTELIGQDTELCSNKRVLAVGIGGDVKVMHVKLYTETNGTWRLHQHIHRVLPKSGDEYCLYCYNGKIGQPFASFSHDCKRLAVGVPYYSPYSPIDTPGTSPYRFDLYNERGIFFTYEYQEKLDAWTEFGNVNLEWYVNKNAGRFIELSGVGTRLAFGGNGDNGVDTLFIFELSHKNGSSSSWVNIVNFKGEKSFATSVSMDYYGDRIAVGSPSSYSNAGSVRIFNVSPFKLEATLIGDEGDMIGSTLDMSSDGSSLVVGMHYIADKRNVVTVYSFVNTSTTNEWMKKGPDICECSMDVAISDDGETVAIGSPYFDDNRGKVSLYKFYFGSWQKVGNEIEGLNKINNAGYSVSLSADGRFVSFGAPHMSDKVNLLSLEKLENHGYVGIYELDVLT